MTESAYTETDGTPPRRVPDDYPSRVGETPELRDRPDPVVYGTPGKGAPLSEDEVHRFERDGYLVCRSLFSEDEVGLFQEELDRLCRDFHDSGRPEIVTEGESGQVRSIFALHELSPLFGRLIGDPRLVDIARFLVDDEVYLHQSRANYKPGYGGREFFWHSDFETWHVEDGMPRMRAVSMTVMLCHNHAYNGPVMLIPGSHKTYVACCGATPESHYKDSLKSQEYGVPDRDSLDRLVRQGGIDMPTGGPGMVLIFDCNAMHGSNGNITPYPRANAFFVYNAVSNALVEPFGPPAPRPNFLANRDFTPIRG